MHVLIVFTRLNIFRKSPFLHNKIHSFKFIWKKVYCIVLAFNTK